jgi:hypothetical protein
MAAQCGHRFRGDALIKRERVQPRQPAQFQLPMARLRSQTPGRQRGMEGPCNGAGARGRRKNSHSSTSP